MRRIASIAVLLLPLLGKPALAASPSEQQPPPVAQAALAGIATAFVPLVIGSSILAQNDSLDKPQMPFRLINAGLGLAPFAGHAVLGEWKRGLLFTAVSAAAAAGTQIMLEIAPDTIQHGEVATRVPFAILFSIAVFSSGVGIADCFFAEDRVRPARVALIPLTAPGAAGLGVGGFF
jgi:hypothetical protein